MAKKKEENPLKRKSVDRYNDMKSLQKELNGSKEPNENQKKQQRLFTEVIPKSKVISDVVENSRKVKARGEIKSSVAYADLQSLPYQHYPGVDNQNYMLYHNPQEPGTNNKKSYFAVNIGNSRVCEFWGYKNPKVKFENLIKMQHPLLFN